VTKVMINMYDIVDDCKLKPAKDISVHTCISHADMSRNIIIASGSDHLWNILSIYTDDKGQIVFDIEEQQ